MVGGGGGRQVGRGEDGGFFPLPFYSSTIKGSGGRLGNTMKQ